MLIALKIVKAIDAVTEWVGRLAAWLVLVAVLVSAVNAIVRKVFDSSSNAWLELQWYLFGAVFMLGAAWVLKNNGHIRIDVLSSKLSQRSRDWIDLIGHGLFLLPFTVLLTWLSVPYVIASFREGEMSYNAGGLIIWPAKALILAGFVLLLLQAIAELVKRIAVLMNGEDATSGGGVSGDRASD